MYVHTRDRKVDEASESEREKEREREREIDTRG
jgi:hypothetical protein